MNRAWLPGLSPDTFSVPATLGRTYALSALCSVAILLSGCIHTQPESVKVFINVPVPCVTTLPSPPNIQPDAELAKLTDAKLITTIAAERLDLRRYHSEASAILTACTTP